MKFVNILFESIFVEKTKFDMKNEAGIYLKIQKYEMNTIKSNLLNFKPSLGKCILFH